MTRGRDPLDGPACWTFHIAERRARTVEVAGHRIASARWCIDGPEHRNGDSRTHDLDALLHHADDGALTLVVVWASGYFFRGVLKDFEHVLAELLGPSVASVHQVQHTPVTTTRRALPSEDLGVLRAAIVDALLTGPCRFHDPRQLAFSILRVRANQLSVDLANYHRVELTQRATELVASGMHDVSVPTTLTIASGLAQHALQFTSDPHRETPMPESISRPGLERFAAALRSTGTATPLETLDTLREGVGTMLKGLPSALVTWEIGSASIAES